MVFAERMKVVGSLAAAAVVTGAITTVAAPAVASGDYPPDRARFDVGPAGIAAVRLMCPRDRPWVSDSDGGASVRGVTVTQSISEVWGLKVELSHFPAVPGEPVTGLTGLITNGDWFHSQWVDVGLLCTSDPDARLTVP